MGADQLLSRSLSELLVSGGDLLRRRGDRRHLGRRRRLGRLGRVGRHWDGGDIDIDCNNCFNNRDFNGKINFNDVDWRNVDRSKINIDRDQFNKLDRNEIRNRVKANTDNSIRDRAKDIKKRDNIANRRPGAGGAGTRDIRKSTLDGLKGRGGQAANLRRPTVLTPATGPTGPTPAIDRPTGHRPTARPPSRPRSAARPASRSLRTGSTTGRRSLPGSATSIAARRSALAPTGATSRWAAAAAAARTSRSGGQAAAAAIAAAVDMAAAAQALGQGEDRIMTKFTRTHLSRSRLRGRPGDRRGCLADCYRLAQDAPDVDVPEIESFLSASEPPVFDTPEAALDAFKAAIQTDGVDAVATLLGLDAAKLKADENTDGHSPRSRRERPSSSSSRATATAAPADRREAVAAAVSDGQGRRWQMGFRHL